MHPIRPWPGDAEEDWQAANRQTESLGGLAVALLLVVIGLFLARELHATALAEDCLLAGRPDCPLSLARTGS